MIQFEKVCIVSDMPIKISRDERNRLHCEDGPAIEWKDGYKLFYFHGVVIKDEKIILTPEKLTKKDWLNEANLEVRRVIQERMGENFVKKIRGKVINKGKYGKLVQVDLGSDPERLAKYVHVKDSSTSREYYLRVPKDIKKADEGIGWTFGLEEGKYNPSQEA